MFISGIIIVVGTVALLLGYLFSTVKATKEIGRLSTENAMLRTVNQNLPNQFEQLASKIIAAQNDTLVGKHKESLAPLNKDIKDFKERIEAINTERSKQEGALKQHLDTLASQNQALGKQAENLAVALKGDKQKQGAWGEYQLERLLDMMGFVENRDYTKQGTIKNEAGALVRPDITFRLTGDSMLIIDSKVSLNNYTDYSAAENPIDKERFLNLYINDIRKHIEGLSAKEYQRLYKISPDYILMFMPIEHAYIQALNADKTLYDIAFKRNIAVVTPSSLMPILRTIQNLWNIEKQNKYVEEIAERSGKMVDQFTMLLAGIDKVQGHLTTASKTIDTEIITKIKGNQGIVPQIEKIKALGAKSTKHIPKHWHDAEEDIPS